MDILRPPARASSTTCAVQMIFASQQVLFDAWAPTENCLQSPAPLQHREQVDVVAHDDGQRADKAHAETDTLPTTSVAPKPLPRARTASSHPFGLSVPSRSCHSPLVSGELS